MKWHGVTILKKLLNGRGVCVCVLKPRMEIRTHLQRHSAYVSVYEHPFSFTVQRKMILPVVRKVESFRYTQSIALARNPSIKPGIRVHSFTKHSEGRREVELCEFKAILDLVSLDLVPSEFQAN